MNRLYAVLLLVLGYVFALGCGSQASSPTIPSQIPTTVEYAQGDVIITGQIEGFGSSSINLTGKSTSSTVDGVYAVDSQAVAKTATFSDSGGYFYLAVPAGQTYVVSLANGISIVARVEIPDLGLHTIPLIFVNGASAAGTVSFDSSNLPDSSAVSVVDLGALQIAASANLSKTSGANFDTAAPSSTTLDEQLNLDSAVADDIGVTDVWITPGLDIDQNEIADYTEIIYNSIDEMPPEWQTIVNAAQLVFPENTLQRLFAKYFALSMGPSTYSTQSALELSNAFADSSLLGTPGFQYRFTTNVENFMNYSVIYLSADKPIVTGSGTYAAGEKIPSCHYGDGSFDFFCDSEGTMPIPYANYYIWLNSDNPSETPLKFEKGLISSSNSVTEEIFVPVPKLVVDGSNQVTSVMVKWQKKDGNSWVDMNDNEVYAVVERWCGSVCSNSTNITLILDDGSRPVDQSFMNDDEISMWQKTLTTPVNLNEIATVFVYYTDISSSPHSFQWIN